MDRNPKLESFLDTLKRGAWDVWASGYGCYGYKDDKYLVYPF
jgi:hypothetical protein